MAIPLTKRSRETENLVFRQKGLYHPDLAHPLELRPHQCLPSCNQFRLYSN